MNMSQVKIFLSGLMFLALCCTTVFGKKVKFSSCGGYSTVSTLDITPCDADTCSFKRGTTVNTTVIFKTKKELKSGTLELSASKFGFNIPLDVDEPKVCTNHNLDCPLEPGKEYKFFSSLKVKRKYPRFKGVEIEAKVKDQDGKPALCIDFDANIVWIKLQSRNQGTGRWLKSSTVASLFFNSTSWAILDCLDFTENSSYSLFLFQCFNVYFADLTSFHKKNLKMLFLIMRNLLNLGWFWWK